MADNSTENQSPTVEEIATGGGDTTPVTVAGGSAGKDGSTFTVAYGRREIKSYPITEDELGHLFWIGLWASFCFSVASLLIGFYINTQISLSFSKQLSNDIVTYWGRLRDIALVLSLILLIVGSILAICGRNRINKIKSKTEF